MCRQAFATAASREHLFALPCPSIVRGLDLDEADQVETPIIGVK
jgi:hypothetical protein